MVPRWTRVTLLIASTFTVMAGATLSPALPAMQAVFADAPHAALLTRLVLTLPALFIVLAAPLAGYLVDRVGRRPLLLGASLLYVLAGSSGVLLDSLPQILVGRALLGVAVAGLMTSVTTLIGDYFDGLTRARILGAQGAFMSLGGVVFVLAGGLLADLHWRAPFLVYLAPLLLMPLILRLPEPARHVHDPDLPLAAMPWRIVSVIYGSALLGMMIFYVIPVQLPYLLAERVGASSTAVGASIAVANVFGGLAGFGFGRVRGQMGPIPIVALVFALMSVGYALIGFAGGYPLVLLGLALAGMGLGLTIPNLSTWLTSLTPPHLRGRLVGGLTTAVFLGQFLSPLAVQPLITRGGTVAAFLGSAVLLALLALLTWLLRRVLHRLHPPVP
ncbi:MAG: MFS transporter [Gammaproteobacteria bacterium]